MHIQKPPCKVVRAIHLARLVRTSICLLSPALTRLLPRALLGAIICQDLRGIGTYCVAQICPHFNPRERQECASYMINYFFVNLILRLHTAPYECQTGAQPRSAQVSVLMWVWYLSRVGCETLLTKVNTIYGDFGSLTPWASSLLLSYPPMKRP